MTSTAPVRLAVVGRGRWGAKILATLDRLAGVEVAVVIARRAHAATEPASTPLSDRFDDALGAAVDGVVLATPAEAHASQVCACLEAGKPVFVEKPLATTVADAARVVEAARRHGGLVHVDHIDLFNPAWERLVAEVSTIGAVSRIEAELGAEDDGRRRSIPARWDWGAHAVAMVVSLLGPPSVVGPARRTRGGAGGAEVVDCELAWPGGATARIVVGDAFEARTRRVVVHGASGTFTYDDRSLVKLRRTSIGGETTDVVTDTTPPLDRALRRFVDAVAARAPDAKDAELGLEVVRVLGAIDAALAQAEAPT